MTLDEFQSLVERTGLTHRQLATELGVSKNFMDAMARGVQPCNEDRIHKIVQLAEVREQELRKGINKAGLHGWLKATSRKLHGEFPK